MGVSDIDGVRVRSPDLGCGETTMGSPGRGRRCAGAVTLGLAPAFAAAPAHAMNYGPGAPETWVFTASAAASAGSVDPPGDTPLGSFVAGGGGRARRAGGAGGRGGGRGRGRRRAARAAAGTAGADG